ncbi:MAG: lytic murein transglycosylase [Hyphomonadaceae bacterium]|nr:lytic murein transglycosylase [Hyphomonadaceae bacterium]MBC6411946.1 lytic murein transglycosylase [Hyphomonadaceae bacterium]
MIKFGAICFNLVLAAGMFTQPAAHAQIPASLEAHETRFAAWKQDFIKRAISRGYDETTVSSLVLPAELNTTALDRDVSQPEFTSPIWSYVDNAVNAERLNAGRRKLAELSASFDRIERRHGVPRHYLTAIWGLESAYGHNQGSHDIIGAMATLVYEGRRQAFFEQQLFAVFDIIDNGSVRPEQLKGSWAGAMGMTQFIPTTFRDYAVDFDGNGNKDLWNNAEDALGSAAHYLSRHGWEFGQAVLVEVELPRNFDYLLADGRQQPLREWIAKGVRPYRSDVFTGVSGTPEARLLVPAGHAGPKFLTFGNYGVIKRYNNSTSYALGVAS